MAGAAHRDGSELGARFDGEVDAFLILALSIYVAPALGAWVLAIGAARYVFLAGERLLPWMRAPLPPRRWRKLVAAAQGVVLAVAAAAVVPRVPMQVLLAVALALLAASMGECTWWLWRRRHAGGPAPERDAGEPGRGPLRTGLAAALTVLALLVVWGALVVPNHPRFLALDTLAQLPLELLVVVALAVVLPATPRRVLAVVAGVVLSVLVLVKVLDLGFYTAFDRSFDPIYDWGYAGIGVETLRDAVGQHRREPHRGRPGRGRRRAPRPPGPGAAARDAGRGRPPRLGAARGRGARRRLGRAARRRRARRVHERLRARRPRGPRGARRACRITTSSRARSPATASTPRPATGC